MKAIFLGLCASFFFAVTFVLNERMSHGGGSWMWSASLRYLFMLPILFALVAVRRNLGPLWKEIQSRPWSWIGWSTVGFGLFYAPLCFSAAYSPAWLVAGTWQFTIIAGSLLVPLFYETRHTKFGEETVRRRIPFRSMGMSLIIFVGIIVMAWSQASHVSMHTLLLGVVPIVIATFAYPLGNRKMMEICAGRLDAYQRTLGMTVASLPVWCILSVFQLSKHGLPSHQQVLQSLIVAVFSGVVATVLFFSATDIAQKSVGQLAAVEATQSGEVVFTLIGELLVISGTQISVLGLVGLVLVVVGMVLHSLRASHSSARATTDELPTYQ